LVYIGLERKEANEKEFLRKQRRAHELNDFELFFFSSTERFSPFHLEFLVNEIR
jgi:hypothetical protein